MTSVGYPSGSKRPGTAYAAAQAAKQRRQLIFIGVLCLGLVGLFVWEAPTFIKLFRGSKAPVAVAPPVLTSTTAAGDSKKILAAVRRKPEADPFNVRVPSASQSDIREAPIPPGSRDPFAAPTVASQSTATTAPLPQQIVIGTPGGNRQASRGWIVILASIPTGAGQQAALRFAATAKQNGIQPIAVLNSSNRKPLRGGYWVVFTGPFKNLNDVSDQADLVHAHGYATAYIRELVVYS